MVRSGPYIDRIVIQLDVPHTSYVRLSCVEMRNRGHAEL